MFILYLNERHHDFTFFKLAFNTGLDPMATRIRASCVTYSKFLCSSVPIHPSRYPSFCNILSLSRSHPSAHHRIRRQTSVIMLTGYFWVVVSEEFCSLFSLVSIAWILYMMDICHFYKTIKYMWARSDTCPNLSGAFSLLIFYIFDLQRTRAVRNLRY